MTTELLELDDTPEAVLAEFCKREWCDGLPIVLITADGRAAEKARQIGAYAYLHKPFELDALLAAIQQGLGGS